MCDYSLHAQPNRLAREGEELILASFPGGSRGFAPCVEYQEHTTWQERQTRPKIDWTWKGIKTYLRSRAAEPPRCPLMAVCVPPGAQLQLEDIPLSMQRELGVSQTEEVIFTQLGYEAYTYRDAVRFNNGKEVLLQRLSHKQRAIVLSLGGKTEAFEDPIEITTYSAS